VKSTLTAIALLLVLVAPAGAAPIPSELAVASDGTDYLVCWTEKPGSLWAVWAHRGVHEIGASPKFPS